MKEVIITGGASIGNWAFYNCDGLTSINIPDSVTSIGYSAFNGCSGVIEVVDGISYVDGWVIDAEGDIMTVSASIRQGTRGIADSAFYVYRGLNVVTIPDSVTSIGSSAFSGCSELTSIKYKGTKAQWNAISKSSDWKYNSAIKKVVCTDGTITL